MGHAPSVQMHDVPPDALSFDDYGEAEDDTADITGGSGVNKYGLTKKPHYHEYYEDDRDQDTNEVFRTLEKAS